MVDGLDVVAVGIEDERPVVAGVVGGALTGRAVVRVARVDRGTVEGVDRLVRVGAERDVDVLGRRLAGDVRDRADLDVVRLVDAELVAQRHVEAPDRRDVTRAERDVVDRAGLALLARVDHLDAVAVRVAQVRADELGRRRGERDVEVLRDGLTVGDDREVAPVDVLGVDQGLRPAEHGEDGLVEALRRVAVGDADVHMVDHPAYCAATSPVTGCETASASSSARAAPLSASARSCSPSRVAPRR